MEHKVVTDYTNVNTQNEYLKVYVRARPPENADHAAEDMFTVGPGPGASGGANKKVVLKVRAAVQTRPPVAVAALPQCVRVCVRS